MHDHKIGDLVPEGSVYMLFAVQGVASIEKAVLFIQTEAAICSAQPSLVAPYGPVSAVRIRPTSPPEQKGGASLPPVNSANSKIPFDSNSHNLQIWQTKY